jgi:DNA-binding NarL/FixJ family response regulator
MTPDIKVLVVDDQRLVREGIASLLDIQAGITVVGMAVDGRQALAQALELHPDVILMDVRMPEMDGITATAEIRRQLPACQILMLTTFDDEEYIIKSLRAGASGYLLKDIPAADLAQAVRLTYAGIYQLSPSVAGKLVGQLGRLALSNPRQVKAPPPKIDLTDRELVSNILSRLGLRDRLQAALFAHEHGLA